MGGRRRALIIHHDSNSLAGLIGTHLRARGFELDERWVTPFGDPTDPGDFSHVGDLDPLAPPAVIVVLGSGRSVYELDVAHWVRPELELLRDADRLGVPTIGICFGLQMLAAAHGGTVQPTPNPEIGWSTVEPIGGSPIEPGPWFQWHLDHATLPRGAELWATSPGGIQGFRLRRNAAVQFHPELDADVLEAWVATDREWLRDRHHDPDALVAETRRHEGAAARRSARLFDSLLAAIGMPPAHAG